MAKNQAQTPPDPEEDGLVIAITPLDQARQRQALVGYRGMTFEELETAVGQTRVDAADAGIGYRLVENADDKGYFIGQELYVLPGWNVTPSKKFGGRWFTSCYVRTKHPIGQLDGATEFIINDGSTGIAQQLAELRERCVARSLDDPPIHCRRGFRVSEYIVMDAVIDETTGEPVIDPRTRKAKKTPRLDPVTNEPVQGTTYYLDTAS